MTDSDMIDKFQEYLEVERGYSNYTVLNYMNDIAEFCDYLKAKKFNGITRVTVNIARYYLMELNISLTFADKEYSTTKRM